MGYRIELSMNLRHCGNRTYMKEKIIDHAKKNNCERYFESIEISGRRNIIHKNFSILTFLFPEEEKYIIQFIKKIKSFKKITIESIAYDNCIFRLFYSKRKNIRCILSPTDKIIINALK